MAEKGEYSDAVRFLYSNDDSSVIGLTLTQSRRTENLTMKASKMVDTSKQRWIVVKKGERGRSQFLQCLLFRLFLLLPFFQLVLKN